MLPSAVKTSCGVKATSVTTQMEKPKPKRCSACWDHHTGTDADGKVFYINRLSVCGKFRGKSPDEKASIVLLAGVCDLCLDWTKDHKAKDCQAKDEQGKMFEPCKQLMKNGSPCGDWHNSLLHGSTNKYCNSIKKKELYDALNEKPSVDEENMEVDEEDQDYSEVMDDPAFLQSVLQNLPSVDLDSEVVMAAVGAIEEEGQAKKAAPGTTTGLSYTGLVGKAARKAKAAEKAARREAIKKEEYSVDEE